MGSVIPGIPDDHLVRIHWHVGPGTAGEYAYKHVPSGIMAGGVIPQQTAIHDFEQQLIAELTFKLKSAGIIEAMQGHQQ